MVILLDCLAVVFSNARRRQKAVVSVKGFKRIAGMVFMFHLTFRSLLTHLTEKNDLRAVINPYWFLLTLFFFAASFALPAIAVGPEIINKDLSARKPNLPARQIALVNLERGKFHSWPPVPLSTVKTPKLEPAKVSINSRGEVYLPELPSFKSNFFGKLSGISPNKDFIFYSLDPQLQAYTEKLIAGAYAPHVAAVVMEVKTGKILAIADKSNSLENAAIHAKYPAASLFKIITAAAALETKTISPYSTVRYRGGTYTLNKYNYQPSAKSDRQSMMLAEALGKSCNPVFARVALQHLTPSLLSDYAKTFGFNSDLQFDSPLMESFAKIDKDSYGFSRTAAGFGNVRISPVHAAGIIAAVANRGLMPRPYIIDRIVAPDGTLLYEAKPKNVFRVVQPATADKLMKMLEFTTTKGTSRSEFFYRNRPLLPGIGVAAKTGTLRGSDPYGLNRWFIAAAPIKNPELALAVISINPGNAKAKPSHIGRLILQQYFKK